MKTLTFETTILTTLEKLWSAWTCPELITKWFAPEANISPVVGGAFELFFDPSNKEHMTTKGCKIIEFNPYKTLSFTWKGPDDFENIMNKTPLTVVNVTFLEEGKLIKVKVAHSGFGDDKQWNDAINWHEIAWKSVLISLRDYLENNEGSCCCS